MSLLSICSDIAADAPVVSPGSVITNPDTDATLLLACCNRAGKYLASYKGGGWTIMGREFTFNTFALNTVGDLAGGSPVVKNIPSTAALAAATFGAAGSGLPGNTYIKSVDSPTQVTLTNPVNAGFVATASAISFGQFAYPLPSDFVRTITDTEWDRSRRWPLIGPRSPQQWQLYKSGLIGIATFQRRWRIKPLVVGGILANYFCLDPTPSDSTSTLVFEYIANSWCQSAAGVVQQKFLADTDTGIIDEDLISLEARWRYLNRRGLAYSAERDEAEVAIARAFAGDGGMPVLDLAPSYGTTLIGPSNIPDTNFGV